MGAFAARLADYEGDPAARDWTLDELHRRWPGDRTTRAELTAVGGTSGDTGLRVVAVRSLAERWPDGTTRAWLLDRFLEDRDIPAAIVSALARHWPDDTTRSWLVERAMADRHLAVREAAVESLAARWPHDETLRTLFVDRASRDPKHPVRRAAVDAVVRLWRDDTTRDLLLDRRRTTPYDAVRRCVDTALTRLGQSHRGDSGSRSRPRPRSRSRRPDDLQLVAHRVGQDGGVDGGGEDRRALRGVPGRVDAAAGVHPDGHPGRDGARHDRGDDLPHVLAVLVARAPQGQAQVRGPDVDPVEAVHREDGVELVERGRGLQDDQDQRLVRAAGQPPDRPCARRPVPAGGDDLADVVGAAHVRHEHPVRAQVERAADVGELRT